jgi:peroxiredoxin
MRSWRALCLVLALGFTPRAIADLTLRTSSFTGVAHASGSRLQAVRDATKPSIALVDLAGATHELKQHSGRVVLVHFFATWCEPCRDELASLSRLTETARKDTLSVLAINVAEVPARLRRFLETTPVSFPVLLDADRRATKAWGVNILPTTFVLDRALVPRLFVEGDVDWMQADVRTVLERLGTADAN